MNYKEISDILKDNLNLKTSPVSIRLFEKESDAREILEKSDRIMHCQAIITAGEGKSFYGTENEIGCPIGASVLGLKEIGEKILNGSQFDRMNVTSTQESGKALIDSVPKNNDKIKAIGYMPLEDSKIKPDVVVIIAKPVQIFDLIRANAYQNGKRTESSAGGTQSLCGDIVVSTIQTDEPHVSFGCMGSHMATELREDQVIIGIPVSRLEEIANSLKTVNRRQ